MAFSADVLRMDPEQAVADITRCLRSYLKTVRRRGLVVAVSGGIDSAVCAALGARAVGGDKMLALLMPEGESASDTLPLSRSVAQRFDIPEALEDISALLEASGCYRRRDACIRSVVPDYGEGWKSKIVLPSVVDSDAYRIYSVVAQPPGSAETVKARLSPAAYLGVVAASNFKQRCRKMLEYYHADRLNYAVIGTPNRLEYDQGFFVKNGDGAADVKPIAHLYKTQVYALAEFLDVPEPVRSRKPTTDTYSLPQGQDEFYFSLPYDKMDICLYGRNHGVSAGEVGAAVGLSAEQVERVYRDIDTKRSTTRYMHLAPVLVEDVPEVSKEGIVKE